MASRFLKNFQSFKKTTSWFSPFLSLIAYPLLHRRQMLFSGYWPKFVQKSGNTSSVLRNISILSLFGITVEDIQDLRESIKKKVPKIVAVNFRDVTDRRKRFNFIADVAEVAAPAVVYVEIRDKSRLDYYSGQPTPISNGSGFIIEEDGLILTNAHVVADNALRNNNVSILVKLLDGRSFDATILSIDRVSDLATIKINAKSLPTLQLGTSGSMKPGEWVVALGSPLALSNTVTCGVISAYRTSTELGLNKQKIVYLQTDAAINQGNSGGPLLTISGEVVGINSMKILPGISFAIPIDHVKTFLGSGHDKKYQQQASKRGRYVGMTMITLYDALIVELRRRKCSLSEKVRNGVLIWKVFPMSPAEQ